MSINALPQDSNGKVMYDRGRAIGTKNYTGVNSTTGVVVSFNVDVKEVFIAPTPACAATLYTVEGTIPGYTDPVQFSGGRGFPVAVPAGTPIFTIKAVSGTIDFGIIILR